MNVSSGRIEAEKSECRARAAGARDDISPRLKARYQDEIALHAPALVGLAGQSAVASSYRAMATELDPTPLEAELRQAGHRTALPVIVKLGLPLQFRLWSPGEELVPRKWGIEEPLDTAAEVEPDVLLLPLLAFDNAGWRLGYGGGFYDRTLERLRRNKTIIAIGLAFCEQEVDAVPHDGYDQRLDFVLTPAGLRSFG